VTRGEDSISGDDFEETEVEVEVPVMWGEWKCDGTLLSF
jgi:hypothetical protein